MLGVFLYIYRKILTEPQNVNLAKSVANVRCRGLNLIQGIEKSEFQSFRVVELPTESSGWYFGVEIEVRVIRVIII